MYIVIDLEKEHTLYPLYHHLTPRGTGSKDSVSYRTSSRGFKKKKIVTGAERVD